MKRILLILFILFSIISVVEAEVVMKTIDPSVYSRLLRRQLWDYKNIFYENGKEVATWSYDKDDNIIKKTGKVPDGFVRGYYKNNVLQMEGLFNNGMLNGPLKAWRNNGVIEYEVTYINDKLNGHANEYYENGVTSIKANYLNGEYEGLVMTYYENGLLKSTEQYKNGIKNGTTIEFFQSGNIKNIFDYNAGIITKKSIKIFDISGTYIKRIDIPLLLLVGYLIIVIALMLVHVRPLLSFNELYEKGNIIVFGYIGYLASLVIYYYYPYILGNNYISPIVFIFAFACTIAFNNWDDSKVVPIKVVMSHLMLIFLFIGGWSVPFNDFQLIYLYVLFGSQLLATGISIPDTVIWNWLILIPTVGLNLFLSPCLESTYFYLLFPWDNIFIISNWLIVCYLGATAYYAVMRTFEKGGSGTEKEEARIRAEESNATKERLIQLAKDYGKKIKVLVVDRNIGPGESFKEILKIVDVEVIIAFNYATGLKTLTSDFDMVILDIGPGYDMDLSDVFKTIKARFPFMPVLICTAYASEESFATAITLGAMEILRKPFLMGEVYSLVEKGVRRRHAANDSSVKG